MYKITDNVDDQYASDINQFTDVLTGNADPGIVTLGISPIAPPTAPTVAVDAVTGNLTGSYQYVVAFLTGYWHGEVGTGTLLIQGNTGYGTASSSVSPSGQQVNITAIPTGPVGTMARIIGRTKANTPGTYYVMTQVNDNTTTSWTDNTPDSGLGAQMNTTNTTGTFLNLGNLASLPTHVPNIPALCIVNGQWYIANSGTWTAMSAQLQPATASVLGGVKIGAGVTVQLDGTISVAQFNPVVSPFV